MIRRARNYLYLRAVTLGTSLTALFLLVRCSVPGRDYSELGIGQTAGSAGAGGDDIILHSSGGQGGEGGEGGAAGEGGMGGQAGAPPVPIPCSSVSHNPVSNDAGTEDAGLNDAGLNDAGTEDAGTEDAGTEDTNPVDTFCECFEGFIRAVDADGDGDGTRACSLAPGLDCDDGDATVTHNSCGGCSALPNAIGEDCLDCGTYVCDGPEAVVCATKPDAVVVDPDCRCVAGAIVARDTDGDGAGTRLCEQNPGIDCNDGISSVITNECGGCSDLAGAVGDPCNECGAYECYGGTLKCGPSPAAAASCNDNKNRHSCNANGFWSDDDCPNVCYAGNCEVCTPGTFRCTFFTTGDRVEACFYSTSFSVINWWWQGSCSEAGALRCDPNNGTCTGSLFLPRDGTFELVPSERKGLPWHDLLNTALDSDYG